MLDDDRFNARLFFPRDDATEPPPHATDTFVGDWHVRRHTLKPAAPTLLLFHGNGEVVSDYDDLARAYADAGANLTVADFPGYGRSRGEPTLRAVIEGAHAVFDAVRPDVVMGRSLGSACANELLSRAVPTVLESGFVDVVALIRRRGLDVPPEFQPGAPFDPLPKLRAARGRLLVLHGAEDTLILPREAEAAHAAAVSADRRLVLIEGRGHNDVSLSPVYWQTLATFIAGRAP
ncbi:MAG: alpha/beta hydrolase [Myxococcaceae bacterium]|nr:alpha/beta hydrolase [Myxococcaceae bacterium]